MIKSVPPISTFFLLRPTTMITSRISLRVFRLLLLAIFLLASDFLPLQPANGGDVTEMEEDHPLANDPELLDAMEIFMGMSPTEREETIRGLMKAVGDDPEKRKEMEYIISQLPAMEQDQINAGGGDSSLKQMIQDDENAKAKEAARKQLDGMSWEDFWANQAVILDNVIANGDLRPEDAILFKTDEEAWKATLRRMWEDLAQNEPGREL
eukprot:CAMPEP_0195541074 /NCGR_PEP_ID=MMETSP0794_2-20130614/50899_1 /TAXON_ID=515487 /ORGANISM="Stephanopyxis turris, Strain CCMP 815" /LENGTH=209 /DNA_ID=CAMNT_0040675159 /DNA_START=8 /DNA_END=637 /DNA_ORIENTATION=-